MNYFLIVNGVIVHVIIILSIFDIYFKSPIVTNVAPSVSKRLAPANRLVLFVADGLRFEAIINKTNNKVNDKVVPFLSELTETKASWGVSYTRVPTESRPGHVALIAGFYEDPSAVFKGWKENTVEFDSVFNESQYTWAWGDPNIVLMFTKGSKRNHIYYDCYDMQQDFSNEAKTYLLDLWVFNKSEMFFKNAVNNKTLYDKLMQRKIVFFFHLLGMDTAGHSHKPNSKPYWYNLKVVDEGIKKMEKLINDFYGDNKTAFVFTADHGMTDWGSHGAGTPHETDTPIIAWGAGVKKNVQKDMNQADIAPLMAALISVPMPVNSVGVLPIEYLDLPENELSLAMYSNARQMIAQFNEKEKRTKQNTWRALYISFPKLNDNILDMYFNLAENANKKGEYQEAIKIYQEVINLALEGLDYYQNYYQRVLLLCTTLSYIGWMVLLLINIFKLTSKKDSPTHSYSKCDALFASIAIFILFLLTSQRLPVLFYLHFLLPVYLWWCIFKTTDSTIKKFISNFIESDYKISYFLIFAIYLVGIEVLVFTFFYRSVIIIALLGISLWPYFSQDKHLSMFIKVCWTANSIILAIFPLLPPVKTDKNIQLVLIYGIIWLLMGYLFIYLLKFSKNLHMNLDNRYKKVMHISNGLMIISLLNIFLIEDSFQKENGLPLHNQLTSWILFVTSFCLPLFGSLHVTNRLVNISFTLSIPIILLSVNYEPVFMSQYFIQLYLWLIIEFRLENEKYSKINVLMFKTKQNPSPVKIEYFRRAYFFLFLCILGFFGTGNMASLNGFDPMWVRNFLTKFSPFTMSALILVKIVIPFLVASCALRAVTIATNTSIHQIFLMILLLGDLMGLHLLYKVTNQGSWLEIGLSISRFIIVQSIVLFLIIFYYLASFLTEANLNINKMKEFRKFNIKWKKRIQ